MTRWLWFDTTPYVRIVLAVGRKSLRQAIIESGVKTLHERGYNASTVRDITRAAGVPLGSFTNHFRSKEAFGGEVLARYTETVRGVIRETLEDSSRPPKARLHAYFDTIRKELEAAGWRQGCLLGNMSLEAAEHSESLRLQLSGVYDELGAAFARALRIAQEAGEIRSDLPPEDIAEMLLTSWNGAMLRMKIDRSPAPIERFKNVLLNTLLA